MTRKGLAMASLALVILMLATALVVGSELPAGTELPVHWDMYGQADRFADKWVALLGPPLFTALLSLFFFYLPRLEPRRQGLERSLKFYAWGWVAVLIMAVALWSINVLSAVGREPPVAHIIAGAVGLMFILMGNPMGKSRSMYMLGVRTPWTLASEEVWIKTHRLGGKLMVAGGFAMVGAAVAGASKPALATVLLVAAGVFALVPTIYSYLLWRGEARERAAEPE